MTMAALAAGMALGLLLSARAPIGHAQQFPTPGPGTGVARVAGTVDIGNQPTVKAIQTGEWAVRIADAPDVRIAVPPFLETGRRYVFTWSCAGDNRVVYLLGKERLGGWVWATPQGAARANPIWINPAQALTIEAIQ